MTSESPRRSCFVIAPRGAEVTPLLDVLRSNSCEPFFISDYLKFGRSTAAEIRTAFKSADFVVVLLLAHKPLENVYLELGIAIGLGRKLLVIAEPNVPFSFDVASFRVNLVSPYNKASLDKAVADFIRDTFSIERSSLAGARAYADSVGTSERRQNPRLAAEIGKLRDTLAEKSPTPEWLEAQILTVLTAAGMPAVEAPSATRRRSPTPDLALWMDSVQREIGNPIAIEVKLRLVRSQLSEIVNRLTASLRSVDAKAGIVIHAQKGLELPSPIIQRDPYIFVFSIDEFLPHLEEGDLGTHLKHLIRSAARKS